MHRTPSEGGAGTLRTEHGKKQHCSGSEDRYWEVPPHIASCNSAACLQTSLPVWAPLCLRGYLTPSFSLYQQPPIGGRLVIWLFLGKSVGIDHVLSSD